MSIFLALLILLYSTAAIFVISMERPGDIAPTRVALIGDSITLGSIYPFALQVMLGSSYNVTNFGVAGTAIQIDTQKPYLREQALQDAKNYFPQIVIIFLGTNDASTNVTFSSILFEADYLALIKEFQIIKTHPEIWLVKPCPIYANNLSLSNMNLVQNVIPSIEHVASRLSLPIVDVYTPLANQSMYFFDGVHPNSRGSIIVANQIFKGISTAKAFIFT